MPAPGQSKDGMPANSLPSDIIGCVAGWPPPAQQCFDTIRSIVFTVAKRADVGPLIETLKWGQPAWLPERIRTGTTLRCNWSPARPDQISLYVNCNTSLVEKMKTIYPDAFDFEGRRGLHMLLGQELPVDAVDHCAFLTLTYHRKAA